MGLEISAATAAYISAAVAAAGTALSYSASMTAAKQSKLNAQAQANAIGAEQQRQAQETHLNQLRKITEQRRFAAAQENMLAGSGFLATTGSPLDIMADTYTAQQRELQDMGYGRDTNNWSLSSRAEAAIGEGNSQAAAIKGQAGGTLLSNLGSTAQTGMTAYNSRKTASSY